MSDDLVSKMRAAADTVISAQSSDDSQEAQEEVSEESTSDEVEASSEEDSGAVEAEEGTEEEESEEAAADNEIVAIRRQAERRIVKAEARTRDLEAKLEQASVQNEKTRSQVAEDIFKKLRRRPVSTFKEFGFEFQDLIDAGIRETTGQDDRVTSEIDELRGELRELRREREEVKKNEQHAADKQKHAAARGDFLGMVTKRDFPTLYNLFEDDPEALWGEAQRLATSMAASGDDISDTLVIRMLDKKYRDRLVRAGGVAAGKDSPKRQSSKTLSTKAASEVRTSGKPFGQLSADEQKAALQAAVKKALTQSPN
jgi:hypothetical protein